MTMRVVSGIKPTGNLHLGNYLGAVKQWVAMQEAVQADGGETLFFIADLHGLTEWIAPADLPGALDPLQPDAGARAQRAVVAAQQRRAGRLAQPHDPVQG